MIGVLQEQNAMLVAQVDRLTARVVELERRLGRNSGNSSLPPSSDLFTRPEKEPKPSSVRSRGKQPGAPGSHLALVDLPDRTEDHLPPECRSCGEHLTLADSTGYVRHQVHDIPLVTVKITEHRLHRCRCACGQVSAAPAPQGLAASPTSYGPALRSLACYLLVFQHVPVERAAQLIADLTGAEVSTGWVASVLAEAADLVAESVKLIKALLTLAHVVHSDETTTRIGDKRQWLHVACTGRLTFLGLAPRSRAGADSLGILVNFGGVIVHDWLSLYDGYTTARHQFCGSHVIRELTAADEDLPGQIWPGQIRWALSYLNKQATRARAQGLTQIPTDWSRPGLTAFHQGIAVGLSLHPRKPGRKQTPTRNLLQRLRDRASDMLRFTDDLHVPLTNNQAERDLRPVKTQVKISGCHQSEAGATAWLTVRSYLSTAVKHGLGAFDAIHRAFTGNLWMPPIAQT